jgi:hypothetical protein
MIWNHAIADGTINNQADENILGSGLLPDQAKVLKDLAHGTCSDEEPFLLSLLHLMRKIQAPHYAYDEIMELVETLVLNKVSTFTASFRSRSTAITQFSQRFQLGPLQPMSRYVEFKDKR